MSVAQRQSWTDSQRSSVPIAVGNDNLEQALSNVGIFSAPRSKTRFIIPGILTAHFAVAVWLCATFNVWVDEYYSMQTTSRDFSYAVSQAVNFEEQPPFYFMTLWAWRQISESVFWGRALSAVCVIGFLAATWRTVIRVLPGIHPAWIITPMALNPVILYAATEMRVAGLTLLLSGLLMWCFFAGFATSTPKRSAIAAYGVISVLALYTHYYLGFLLVGNGVALLVTRRWRSIALYYGIMGLVALAYMPMFLSLDHQADGFAQRTPFEISYFAGIRVLIERVQNYLWPAMGLHLDGWRRWMIAGSILIGAVVAVGRRRRQAGQFWIILFAVVTATGFGLALAASRFGWQSMLERHALPVLLPGFLCFYGIFALYQEPVRRRMLMVWTTGVVIVSILSLHAVFNTLAKSGDWKRIAEYIEANERPNEAILIFPADAYYSFKYHYRGKSEVLAIPRPDQFLRYNHPDDTLKHDSEIVAALNGAAYDPASIWVLVNCNPADCGYLGVDYNLKTLEHFLAENYAMDKSHEYFGASLRHGSPSVHLANK